MGADVAEPDAATILTGYGLLRLAGKQFFGVLTELLRIDLNSCSLDLSELTAMPTWPNSLA